eukprot:m.1241469 g.1241469  ORF g.1241469 m.1241469 type:complete len:88 (+) comp24679_c1_seq1:4260-4523(+)
MVGGNYLYCSLGTRKIMRNWLYIYAKHTEPHSPRQSAAGKDVVCTIFRVPLRDKEQKNAAFCVSLRALFRSMYGWLKGDASERRRNE